MSPPMRYLTYLALSLLAGFTHLGTALLPKMLAKPASFPKQRRSFLIISRGVTFIFLPALLAACALFPQQPSPEIIESSATIFPPSLLPATQTQHSITQNPPTATPLPPTDTPLPPSPTPSPTATNTPFVFAVIGDFGKAGPSEAAVAALVQSWNPEIIITVGDDNYPSGEASTIDENIGQYYHSYIFPYNGIYGVGADVNRFFPTLGNHDWQTPSLQPYLDYFTLPGNERYYDFVWGPIHFFALDSDSREPDGVGQSSAQAQWFQNAINASTSPWQIVYMHHPAYSSGHHGSTDWMRWPFKSWGTDVILAGHEHLYERLEVDGLPYITNGLGGHTNIYSFPNILPESLVRYREEYGALRVTATETSLTLEFINIQGELIDSLILDSP